MQNPRTKKTFGLFFIIITFQILTIGVNQSIANSHPTTKIDTLVVLKPFISITNLNENAKQPDSLFRNAINAICINEINDVLTDKYYLATDNDTTGCSFLKDELDSLSVLMANKSKKELKQSPQSYQSILSTRHQHILVVSIEAWYDDRYPIEAPLQQSMMASQLTGTSTLIIPIIKNKTKGFTIKVFLLDSTTKKIVHFNQFKSFDDPRNLQLIKDKIYKMLKPIYYW